MTWRERFRDYTRSERLSRLEVRIEALEKSVDAKFVVVEQRMGRVVWQCRRIVKSVVRQFTGRVDDGEDD